MAASGGAAGSIYGVFSPMMACEEAYLLGKYLRSIDPQAWQGVDVVLISHSHWDHLDYGLDKEWLWEDWQEAISEQEVADCRWTPCYDCGVCPTMGTEIQIGPTGRSLLPLTVV